MSSFRQRQPRSLGEPSAISERGNHPVREPYPKSAVILSSLTSMSSCLDPVSSFISLQQPSAFRVSGYSPFRAFGEIGIAYTLIVASVWTPNGIWKVVLMALCLLALIGFTVRGPFDKADLGLQRPPLPASIAILVAGASVALTLPAISAVLGMNHAPHPVPLGSAWQYLVWAQIQEFILLSFIFVRLERYLAPKFAVGAAALLFAIAHVPSPVLTTLTLIGGLCFCALFRRVRNIYALGLVHGMLGLTVAASFSDQIMHHMRVGNGYVMFFR